MGYLTCPLCCGKSFSNRKSLQYHLLSSESNISCPECHQPFYTIVELADHLELDSCEQQAVVISVSSERVDQVGSVAEPTKSTADVSCHETACPAVCKEEVVNCSAEDQSWLEDGADYEPDAVNVSHDSDAIQRWERQAGDEGDDEETEHYCNSCNCKVFGVLEHINRFHATETVILQNAEAVDTEVVETELGPEEEEEEEEEQPAISHPTEFSPTTPDPTPTPATAMSGSKSDVHDPAVRSPPTKKTKKTSARQRLPKVYGTVDESNMVDARTGIPYVRRIVHIEKFWEKELCQLGGGGPVAKPGRRRVRVGDVAVPNERAEVKREVVKAAPPVVKVRVPPKRKKPALVQAHISQLLRSRAIDTLKETWVEDAGVQSTSDDILQRLLSAANEQADRPPDPPPEVEVKEEDRSSTIRFVVDGAGVPLGEGTLPLFLCNACGAEFEEPQDFASHRCKPTKAAISTLCEVCGLRCKSVKSLRTHMETHDPRSKVKKLFEKQVQKLLSEPATCEVCKTEFTTAGGLKVHRRMHRPDNVRKIAEMNNKVEYRCDLCNMICYSERTFRIHYSVHVAWDREPETPAPLGGEGHEAAVREQLDLLACKLCSETFSSNEDLKSHWQSHYPVAAEETVPAEGDEDGGDGEWFVCPRCGKHVSEGTRDAHERTHRADNTQFGCSVCNKHFGSEVNLEFHMTTHRTEIELECLTCKTKFTDPALLKLHRKTHAGTNRPYPCGFCGRRFSRPHEKVKHERIHTGEKPYECATCGMRFRVGYCLKMHERIHTGVRPYTCEHCGKTFRARSGYKQHVRLHSDVRAFVCPFCPKTFKTVVQLAGHKKSHTKPYSCPACGRRFATMYMVRAHVNTHAKSSLKHRCYICGASYGRDYALRDHIKTHGKNVPPPPPEETREGGSDASDDSDSS